MLSSPHWLLAALGARRQAFRASCGSRGDAVVNHAD
jgi:hypothetical protein